MNFETIVSKETTAKNQKMAENISQWLAANSENQAFFIVPDHIKFSAELEMIQRIGKLLYPEQQDFAVTRFQVFSFKRLAWYLLRDDISFSQPTLSKVGVSMVLQKILKEHQDEFVLFHQESRHKGFIERLASVMNEFQQGGIEVEDFTVFLEQETPSEIEQRLKEFGTIYRYYLAIVERDFAYSDDVLRKLITYIHQMDLTKTYVVVDQAVQLTALELEVMEALALQSGKMEFHTTLTSYGLRPHQREEQNLFASNRQLIHRLFEWLFISEEKAVISEWQESDESYQDDFRKLEQFWLETSGGLAHSAHHLEKKELQHLHWTTYKDEQQEIQETLSTIKQLVESGQYRYQDIQLLSRDLEKQKIFLEPMLQQYDIPAFIDLSDTMEHHPLVQVLDAIYAIHQNYWRYSDVMSLLRSEYCFWHAADGESSLTEQIHSFRHQLDETENIILAQGYEGFDWLSSRPWNYSEEAIDEETMDLHMQKIQQQLTNAQKLREQIVSTLEPFYQKLNTQITTREAVTQLYHLLEQIGVPQSVLYWRDHAAENGNVEMARRQEQVWNEFLALLDEFVYIFGEDTFDWEIFQILLHTGFEQTHYHMAPSTLDQLTCTGIDAVRFSPKKVSFVLGLAQGSLPRMEEESGLLTDEERVMLGSQLDSGRFLQPTTVQKQFVEPYIFYKVLTSATDELYLSMSLTIANTQQKTSNYVERLREAFIFEEINGDDRQQKRFANGEFVSWYELFSVLLTRMRQYKFTNVDFIPTLWLALSHLLKQDTEFSKTYQSLINSVFKLNTPKNLPTELANQLYGSQLYLSTSQIEKFYSDPFSYFLQYGLRLQERREFELTAAGAGEYFHEVLDQFIKEMQLKNLLITQLTDEQLEQLWQPIFAKMQDDSRFTILRSSARMKFIEHLLQETIQQTLRAVQLQLQALQVKPWRTEVQFGTHTDTPVEFPLNNMQKLLLRGKIDRIDLLETPEYLTMSIVDYKSSSKTFDINQLQAGTQLQLLTYMMIAKQIVEQNYKKTVKPFGGLYMHVHQPNFQALKIKNMEEWSQYWLKEYRLKGLLTNEETLLKQVEPDFEKGSSLYLPYGKTQKGDFTAASSVVTPEELDTLMDFTFHQIRLAGERILGGDIQLAPFEHTKQFADSVTGKFSSISQFDATNPENRYRKLPQDSLKQGIEHIKTILEGGE